MFSDEEDGGDADVGEQEEINTTLSAEDAALFAELMQVIKSVYGFYCSRRVLVAFFFLNSPNIVLFIAQSPFSFFAEGGELKKLRVDHLKSYLRYHGLRISGLKDVLVSRIEQHLK